MVVGKHTDIICRSLNHELIDNCLLKVTGFENPIKIVDGLKTPKYDSISNLKNGECVMRLKAEKKNDGPVECVLQFVERQADEKAKGTLQVLSPLESLTISTSNTSFQFNEDKLMHFNVSAQGGIPTAASEGLFKSNCIFNRVSLQSN